MTDALTLLKARARTLGLSIKRGRGTGSGHYTVHRPRSYYDVWTCHGLDEVEDTLARIENLVRAARAVSQ